MKIQMKIVMKIATTLVLLAALNACANSAADFGESQRNNREVQLVNPDPATRGETPAGMDGIKAGIAIEEYKKADNRSNNERLVRDVTN